MSSQLGNLIKKSMVNPEKEKNESDLVDKLIKNADKAMGLEEDNQFTKKGGGIKNLTFTFGLEEVDLIDQQIERFLQQGKYVSKSELMRIGLQLIINTKSSDLKGLTTLITKHQRGRK